MDTENKLFSEILSELITAKGYTAEKISASTEIPLIYLESILFGNLEKLPAAPYVRGYIMKIGEILGEDGNALWEEYKKENNLRKSGSHDKLPPNRFALNRAPSYYCVFIIVGVVVAAIIGVWILKSLRVPRLSIDGSSDQVVATASTIILSGKIDRDDKLTINEEEITPEENGKFSKEFLLQEGINTFEFKAKKFLGKEKSVIRQVIYELPNDQLPTNEINI